MAAIAVLAVHDFALHQALGVPTSLGEPPPLSAGTAVWLAHAPDLAAAGRKRACSELAAPRRGALGVGSPQARACGAGPPARVRRKASAVQQRAGEVRCGAPRWVRGGGVADGRGCGGVIVMVR